MKPNTLLIAGLLLLIAAQALCQPYSPASPSAQSPLMLRRISQPIQIDGKLEESDWFRGAPARNFWQYFPSDTSLSPAQTEVYMAYDDQNLYIGAICRTKGNDFVITSLRRDYRHGGNDNVTFVIDPFRDRTNAFVFGMNPVGVMREALISNGGQDSGTDWNSSWDNKWRGASHIYDTYWSCELAIPFSTLRFKEGEREWNFNCYRNDTQTGTESSWNRIPQNQIIMNLAYMSPMIWEEPLKKAGPNVSLIPYTIGRYTQQFLDEEEGRVVRVNDPGNYEFNAGGDVKIALTPGLNLDLTVNPDFSQVEVDQQVVDLSRFELFFPERRQFFLENADLFSSFGDGDVNPFFSRRIGVGRDTATGENLQIPILAGARLSGKLDNNWRLGLLNMQTDRDGRSGPGYNYSVAAVQRKLFSRSYAGAIFVNKQTFEDLGTDTSGQFNRYNRVLGFEYNLASSDNVWTGKAYYQHSFSPNQDKEPFAHGANINYQVDRLRLEWRHQYVGSGYDAEVGFVPRTNYYMGSPEVQLFFYPKKGLFTRIGPGIDLFALGQPGFGIADYSANLYLEALLRNTGELNLEFGRESTFLFEEFDPSKTGAIPLPGDARYSYTYLSGSYESDRRKRFSYSIEPYIGQYFNGFGFAMGGGLLYRYQPYGSIELNFNYTYIDLPAPYAQTGILLVGPRIDLTLTRSLFLTTFIQYNDQLKNININSRLQWRFAPVSDFFLVYTDNYLAQTGLQVRNRALVAKLTYWLNL